MKNSDNWYNSSIFRSFCSSWNLPVYRKLKDWLKPGSNVLDVGCGSGEFLIDCSEKIAQGTGLELSSKLIEQAKIKSSKLNISNLTFNQMDFLNWQENQKLNTITFIFVLHEIDPLKREELLMKALDLAETVIISEYRTPQPLNPAGLLNWLAEALTAKEHYKNFREFHSVRWLNNFIADNQVNVLDCNLLYSGSYQLLKLSR
ncbi:class I SAM-dependent methyltransferase [Candidatus Cloacimonadota bacterium]